MKIIFNTGNRAFATTVHGHGLTGVERATSEFGGHHHLCKKYAPQFGALAPADFAAWLADRGCELGVTRDGKYFRVVSSAKVVAREKYGRAVCYALPQDAYPFDRI